MVDEEWKKIAIDDRETQYEISNLGKVRNRKGNLLKLRQNLQGYIRCYLYIDGKLRTIVLHKLLAKAFISNPDNLSVINHKDYDVANNRLDNLEWITQRDNIIHSYKKKGRKRAMKQVKIDITNIKLGDIPGYTEYKATKDGRIYSIKSKIFLKGDKTMGYEIVSMKENGKEKKKRVHILMAKTYISNPNNKQLVNHKDGNKFNNHFENLEWVTNGENMDHAVKLGLKPTKGGVEQYDLDKNIVFTYSSLKRAANAIGVDKAAISRCCLGKQKTSKGYIWKYKN